MNKTLGFFTALIKFSTHQCVYIYIYIKKENPEFKSFKLTFKIDLVLCPACAEGLGIYIYNYEWRNWNINLEITMTRKSSTHLHATYGALNSCFNLIRSHQQCTLWSPPLEIKPTTTVCRSRNSTTGPLVHATYNQCWINKSWQIARPLDRMCLFYRYVFPKADTATSGATSSQVGVTSPHNISLMGRK